MSTWPEERLRKRVDATGGPVEMEVAALLGAFGARRFTGRARRNVEQALRQVDLDVDPPLETAPAKARVRISPRRAGGRSKAAVKRAAPAAKPKAAAPRQAAVRRRHVTARPQAPKPPRMPPSPQAKFALGLVAGLVLVGVFAGIVASVLGSGGEDHSAAPAAQTQAPKSHAKPAPTSGASTAGLTECVNHWNSPGNPTQRALFASEVRSAGEGTTVADQALVLRYSGPELREVGVGIAGVNLGAGDCVVVHPTNVVFGFTDGMWHQIGSNPGSPVADLAKKAASSPNASVDLGNGNVTLAAAP